MLSIGASGVRAYQTALATVGENIANVNSAGYTRRQVALNEVAGVGTTFAYAAGNGVTLTGVTRSTDIYSSRALRAANSDLSRTTSGAAWLDRIPDKKDESGKQLLWAILAGPEFRFNH